MTQSQNKRVIYAGSIYEVIYGGDRVLHLRSEKDRDLVVKCSINSEFLKEIEEIPNEDTGDKSEPPVLLETGSNENQSSSEPYRQDDEQSVHSEQ